MKVAIHILVAFSAFISALISIFPVYKPTNGYELMYILPIAFIICYFLFIVPLLRYGKNKFTVITITIITWIRYVIIPFFSSYTGTYDGVAYIYVSSGALQIAIFLMVYEIFIVSIFLFLLVRVQKSTKGFSSWKNYELKGNKNVYWIFVVFALIIYLLFGYNNNILQFFIISADTGDRVGDVTSTNLVIARQIILIGVIFLFLLVVDFAKRKYEASNQSFYVNMAILFALLNVSIIVGERRSVQIYTAVATILVLINTFPNYRRKIIVSVTSMAGIVLILMSMYKFFTAFYYDSYFEAFNESSFNASEWAATLQSYFFGLQNIAVAVEMANDVHLNMGNLFYDFLRSIFGLSFLLKDITPMTIEHFNTYIYGFEKSNGHILSSIGYGYLYFGIVFAPIIICINIWIAIKVENLLYKTTSLEMIYLLGYILVRISRNVYSNTAPLISLGTMMMITFGVVYVTALLFNKKRRERYPEKNNIVKEMVE